MTLILFFKLQDIATLFASIANNLALLSLRCFLKFSGKSRSSCSCVNGVLIKTIPLLLKGFNTSYKWTNK